MTSQITTRRKPPAGVERLKDHLRDLGFCVSLWDAQGNLVSQADADPFCAAVHGTQEACSAAFGCLVRQGMSAKTTVQGELDCGCCGMVLPVNQRRRQIGSLALGFPVREMLEPSAIQELRRRYSLNDAALDDLEKRSWRGRQSREQVARMVTWMLEEEQGLETASSEISTLSANLASTYEELSLLYSISGSMKVTQGPREFLQRVCNELTEVLNLSAAAAVIKAQSPTADDEVVIAGQIDLNADQIKLLASTMIAPRLTADGRPTLDNHVQPPPASGLGCEIKSYAATPMADDKSSIGLLVGINKRGGDFESSDLKLIHSIGSLTAVFLANSRLYADMQNLLMGVLHALTATIDAKDPYTCGHSQRVALLSQRLAEASGLPAERAGRVYLMGLLHDIGKIGVPESVLMKPGRLTDAEYERLKCHPAVGAEILGGIRQLDDVVVGILTHHERPDGRGYPRGLKGDDVPLDGLIVGLADSFDAMTSNRTYRAALPLATAIEEIRRHAGEQFDKGLVDKFLAIDLEKFLDEGARASRTIVAAIRRAAENAERKGDETT